MAQTPRLRLFLVEIRQYESARKLPFTHLMKAALQNENRRASGMCWGTGRMAKAARFLQARPVQAASSSLFFWVKLLVCATFPILAVAEETNSVSQFYTIKVWGADEGLVEASVTEVAQTPEGYLWVGTLFGSVLRFDGVRFVSYNSANTPEFSQKWGVPRLMVDRGGTLWISMLDGGMTTWDKAGFRLRQQGNRRQAFHQHRDRHLALAPHLRQAPRPLPHPGGVEVPGPAQGPAVSLRSRLWTGVPHPVRPPLKDIHLTRHARFPVSHPLLPSGLGGNS